MADKSGWHGLVLGISLICAAYSGIVGGEVVLWVIVLFTAVYGSVLHPSVELTAQCRPCCFHASPLRTKNVHLTR